MTTANSRANAADAPNRFLRYVTLGLAALAGTQVAASRPTSQPDHFAGTHAAAGGNRPVPHNAPAAVLARPAPRRLAQQHIASAQAFASLSADAHVARVACPECVDLANLSADGRV